MVLHWQAREFCLQKSLIASELPAPRQPICQDSDTFKFKVNKLEESLTAA